MMSTFFQILGVAIFTLTGFDLVCGQTTATEWPYNSKITFPHPTYSPINVNTSAAIPLVAPPIQYTYVPLDVFKLMNVGTTIEAHVVNGNTTAAISGGPLFDNIYRLHKVRFYWNNQKGRCGTAVDGHGEPLEIITIFYKDEYRYFDNALQHRDGVAVTSVRVTLKPKTNFLFCPVQNVLKTLQKPGNFAYLAAPVFYAWYNAFLQLQYYYTYPGSYVDFQNGKQYQSSIELVFEPVIAYISDEQFKVFQSLKNIVGGPLQNTVPAFPVGCRPILKGTGFALPKYAPL